MANSAQSVSYTAMSGTAGKTYTHPVDGDPYRCDENGIVFVKTAHVTAMSVAAIGMSTVTAATLASKGHAGVPTVINTENHPDHG